MAPVRRAGKELRFLAVRVDPDSELNLDTVELALSRRLPAYLRVTMAIDRQGGSGLLGAITSLWAAPSFNCYADYDIFLVPDRPGGEDCPVHVLPRDPVPAGLAGAGQPRLRLCALSGRGLGTTVSPREIEALFGHEAPKVIAASDPLIVDACFGSVELATCSLGTHRIFYQGSLNGGFSRYQIGSIEIVRGVRVAKRPEGVT